MGGESAEVTEVEEEVELSPEQQAAAEAAKKKAEEEAAGGEGGESGEDQGFDVIEEGATPASGRVIPLSAHIKAKGKWKETKQRLTNDAAAKAQEAELLRLQLQQRDEELARLKAPKGPPKRADFESDEAFDSAAQKWSRAQTELVVDEALRKRVPAAPTGQQTQDDDKELDAHYERAAKLKADDFDAMEDEVIAALGKEAARHIIKLFDNSEAVVYALGKNPKRLAELAGEIKTNPVRAIKNLTEYASKLQLKPRGKAPDPDASSDLRPSGGGGNPQKQLDRLRTLRDQGKASTDDILKFKRECRAKGIKVS